MTREIDYRRAFKIACDLLSGAILYGVDSDEIFKTMMDRDGVVTKDSYEEYILNHLQELDHGEYAFKALEQEPKWIPVSEKLPEPFTFVNATCRSLVDDRENWVVETIYLPIPKEANKHGYSDWGNIPMLNWGGAEVIAWVERVIPQPYKADSEDKE